MKKPVEPDYSSLLDGPADQLKGLLTTRAKSLATIDKATQALREAIQNEGVIRAQIRELLDAGGRPMKDVKIALLSGVDIFDRTLKQLAAGNVLGNDRRDDKTVAPATCASLADYHEQIAALFEKALAGEVPREAFAPLPTQIVRA